MRPLNKSEKRFISRVRKALERGRTWEQLASEIGEPLSTVYNRFQRLELRELKQNAA